MLNMYKQFDKVHKNISHNKKVKNKEYLYLIKLLNKKSFTSYF